MNKTFKQITICLMVVGVIAFSLATIFSESVITLISRETNYTTGISYYKINVHDYFVNLQQSVGQTTYLQLESNPLNWETTSANITQEEFWNVLVNNLAYIFNWIIYGINIIIYPLRLGGYIFKQFLAVLGFSVQETETKTISWMVNLANGLTELQIPFINP